MTDCRSAHRDQLRAAADQRVHDAMVPHVILQLSAAAHGAPGLGSNIPRGQYGAAENRSGHLGRAIRVSVVLNTSGRSRKRTD